jgi:SAM-dependent methyltransferase
LNEGNKPVNVVDIGCCYGNTTLMFTCGFTWNDTVNFWKGKIQLPDSRNKFYTTGIDISANPLKYGQEANIFDQVICSDLNAGLGNQSGIFLKYLKEADVLLMVMCTCYFDIETIRYIFREFLNNSQKDKIVIYDNLITFDNRNLDPGNLLPPDHQYISISDITKHRNLTIEEKMNFKNNEAVARIYILNFSI